MVRVNTFARAAIVLCLAHLCFASQCAQAEGWQYSIKPEQVVSYRVKITADTPTAMETMQGVIAYRGQASEADRFTVTYSGGLSRSSKAKQASRPSGRPGGFRPGPGGRGRIRPGGGPPVPRGPAGMFGGTTMRGLTQTNNELVVSGNGEVLSMQGDSQLPYVLGNLSLMAFEPLGDGAQQSWRVANGVTITEKGSDSRGPFGPRGPRGLPGAGNDEKTTGGSESTNYVVQSDDGNLVTIERTYALTSPPPTGDDSGYTMNGVGAIVFNRELSVLESVGYSVALNIGSGNSTVSIPVNVSLQRMTDDEFAAYQKEREEMFARAKEQRSATNKNAPFSDEKREEMLTNLNSSNRTTVMREMQSLWVSNRRSLHPDDAEIVEVLGKIKGGSDRSPRHLAGQLYSRLAPSVKAATETKDGDDGDNGADEGDPKKEMDNPFKKVEPGESLKGMRTWSDATGRFTIEAEFVELKGKTVHLKQKNGSEMKIALSDLSKSDQELIKKAHP